MADEQKFLIGMVLDSTGSMNEIKSDAIGGFNEYVESMKRDDEGNTRFTLCVFNSQKIDFPYHVSVPEDVKPLTDRTYVPRASTPLYDAIGMTIAKMDDFLEDSPAFQSEDRQLATLTILTDGLENASKEYTRSAILKMIEERKERGWGIIFLAADIDAFAEGGRIGVDRTTTSGFAKGKMRQAMRVAYASQMRHRESGGLQNKDLITDEERKELSEDE